MTDNSNEESVPEWVAYVSLTGDDDAVAYGSSTQGVPSEVTGQPEDQVLNLNDTLEILSKCGYETVNLDDPKNAALRAELTSKENLGSGSEENMSSNDGGLTANDAACLPPNPDGYGYE